MAVSDEQVAAVKSLLAGDIERHDELRTRLNRQTDAMGYSALISGAFVLGVHRRFGSQDPTTTQTNAIDFISKVRARSPGMAEGIDPTVAERLVLAVLGMGDDNDIDDETRLGTQFLLAGALIADEGLDDAQLDELMGTVREVVEAWLGD